jgi:hypothetical protein
LQRSEITPSTAVDHEFAVEHCPGGDLLNNGRDDLGEVRRQRLLLA